MSLKAIFLHILTAALTLICGGLIYFIVFNTYTVTFTEAQAKANIAKILPLTFAANAGLLFKIGDGTTVAFKKDQSIVFTGQLVATPMMFDDSRFQGFITLSAKPTFRNGTFYARDVFIGKVTGNVIISERVKAGSRIATKAAKDALASKTVQGWESYATDLAGKVTNSETVQNAGKMATDLANQAAASETAKTAKKMAGDLTAEALATTGITPDDIKAVLSVNKVKANLPKTLEARFEEVPLFTLSGTSWWQVLARGTLENLDVFETQITARIPLSRLYLGILLAVFVVLAGIVFRFTYMLKDDPVPSTFGRPTPAA